MPHSDGIGDAAKAILRDYLDRHELCRCGACSCQHELVFGRSEQCARYSWPGPHSRDPHMLASLEHRSHNQNGGGAQ